MPVLDHGSPHQPLSHLLAVVLQCLGALEPCGIFDPSLRPAL